ncbi:MAG: ADP-ribosylation factor-like protein [Promethearchaeota archaeon]
MMGLDNAGKTSIAKNVFENKSFSELKSLKPTEFVETHEYQYRQMIKINIFDCGGQAQFMQAYKTSEFKNKIFNKVNIMIWVVDSSDKLKIKTSLIEFSKCYLLLEQNSPNAEIYFLIHKFDSKKIETKDLRKMLKEVVTPKVKIHYYTTSIKNNSARIKMKRILDDLMEESVGDRVISLQDLLHKLNQRIKGSVSILFNSEYGIEIASFFEKYLEMEKAEFLEYISLKFVEPSFLAPLLKEFNKQGFLKKNRSDFSVYRVGDDSICIVILHKDVSLFTISTLDSLAKIEKEIEKFKPEILSILKLS